MILDDDPSFTLTRHEAIVLLDALRRKIDVDEDWDPEDPLDCALNGLMVEIERVLGEPSEALIAEHLPTAKKACVLFYAEDGADVGME